MTFLRNIFNRTSVPQLQAPPIWLYRRVDVWDEQPVKLPRQAVRIDRDISTPPEFPELIYPLITNLDGTFVIPHEARRVSHNKFEFKSLLYLSYTLRETPKLEISLKFQIGKIHTVALHRDDRIDRSQPISIYFYDPTLIP